jgi:caffeoyl-CoA O-methyltransferase
MDSNLWRVLNRLEERSKLERSGKVSVLRRNMMLAITYETGLFFNILLKAMKAKRALEIGTSTGYSALWLAEALLHNKTSNKSRRLDSDKALITIEKDPRKIKRASKNFSDAKVSDKIYLMGGPALENLLKLSKRTLKNKSLFDFIFLDADKENLKQYFDLVLPLLRDGGIIATDNVLYPEDYRPIMKSFLKYVRAKPDIKSVTIPIGHGEEITTKCASQEQLDNARCP